MNNEEEKFLKKILEVLNFNDLKYICYFFNISTASKKFVMKNRIIKSKYTFNEIIKIAGYVLLLDYVEESIKKEFFSIMLEKANLPYSGNKHTLALRVIENDLITPRELLINIPLSILRDIYSFRYGKVSTKSKSEIIPDILISFGLNSNSKKEKKSIDPNKKTNIVYLKSGKGFVFVLMPFSKKLKKIYVNIIKPTVESLNYECKRADDFFTTNKIMDDIEKAINKATFIIADLTGKNPNVFYEVGMSHILKKNVILLAQSKEDIPFDLRQWRHIQYNVSKQGLIKLKKDLEKTIKSITKS